jgi:hypothetical protein
MGGDLMTPTRAPAAALLVELTRRGIELQARGDRLRYRPRSAMTPALAKCVEAHKPDLLALLRQDRHRARWGDIPHEPSLAERIEQGYINAGWTPAAWAERLQQLAERCEALRPGLAALYRKWAANVMKNSQGLA